MPKAAYHGCEGRLFASHRSGSRVKEILANTVLDALAAQVAVLDGDGKIVAVNDAWKRFGRANGCADDECYVGWNYLSVLDAARRDPSSSAETILTGIRSVMSGHSAEFEVEYPCHSPAGPGWYVMNVTRAPAKSGARFVVAHSDITARKQSELALQRTEQLLRTVLDALPVGVWIMDQSGRIIEGNPAGKQIWAGARYVGPEQFGEYKGWWLHSGKPIEPDEWAAARAIQKGEVSIDEEIEIECFDGTHKIMLNSAIPLRDLEGAITGAIIVNQDITSRKRGEAALQETSNRLQTLFDILPVGVSIVNADRQVIQMNGSLERLLRLTPNGLNAQVYLNRSYFRRDGSPFDPSDFPSGRAKEEGRPVAGEEIGVRLEDGEMIWVNVSAAPLPGSSDVVIVTADITERIRTEEELVRAKESIEQANQELKLAYAREHLLARTDSLTGVRNRRHFYDIASHEFTVARRYAQDISVILLDIDFFKRVNDTYGHERGDVVLRKVAELASSEVREADLLARFGGEEFIVLLPNTPSSVAATVAERMRAQIENHNWAASSGIEGLTISAGVADFGHAPATLDELIRRADSALYSAKSNGRNRVAVFEPVAV